MTAARERATALRAVTVQVPQPRATLIDAINIIAEAIATPLASKVSERVRDLLVEFDNAKPPARRLYDANEVAAAIGRSRATVYRCFDEGAPYVLVGDTRMVILDEFIEWLKTSTAERARGDR